MSRLHLNNPHRAMEYNETHTAISLQAGSAYHLTFRRRCVYATDGESMINYSRLLRMAAKYSLSISVSFSWDKGIKDLLSVFKNSGTNKTPGTVTFGWFSLPESITNLVWIRQQKGSHWCVETLVGASVALGLTDATCNWKGWGAYSMLPLFNGDEATKVTNLSGPRSI